MGGNEGNLSRNVTGYDGFAHKICTVRHNVRSLDFKWQQTAPVNPGNFLRVSRSFMLISNALKLFSIFKASLSTFAIFRSNLPKKYF